jgi:hypothetical protein
MGKKSKVVLVVIALTLAVAAVAVAGGSKPKDPPPPSPPPEWVSYTQIRYHTESTPVGVAVFEVRWQEEVNSATGAKRITRAPYLARTTWRQTVWQTSFWNGAYLQWVPVRYFAQPEFRVVLSPPLVSYYQYEIRGWIKTFGPVFPPYLYQYRIYQAGTVRT